MVNSFNISYKPLHTIPLCFYLDYMILILQLNLTKSLVDYVKMEGSLIDKGMIFSDGFFVI